MPAGRVSSKAEFEGAQSFIQLMEILPQPGIHYYTNLHGIQGSTRFLYQIVLSSYPDINPTQGTTRPTAATDSSNEVTRSTTEGNSGIQNTASLSTALSYLSLSLSLLASLHVTVLVY